MLFVQGSSPLRLRRLPADFAAVLGIPPVVEVVLLLLPVEGVLLLLPVELEVEQLVVIMVEQEVELQVEMEQVVF